MTHLLTADSTTGGASIGDVSREVLSPSLSPQLNDTHSKTGGSISPHGKENQNGSQLKGQEDRLQPMEVSLRGTSSNRCFAVDDEMSDEFDIQF